MSCYADEQDADDEKRWLKENPVPVKPSSLLRGYRLAKVAVTLNSPSLETEKLFFDTEYVLLHDDGDSSMLKAEMLC